MDVQTQVMQVTVRNTRTGRSVYDVACSDGQKRSCWDPNLAAQLNSYAGTGQTITLRVDVKPSRDGRFMNHDIQAVAGPGQQLPPDTNFQAAPMGGAPPMMAAAPPVAMGGNVQPIQAAPQSGNNGGDRFPPQVTTRITKLASYEYAATVVGGIFAGSGPEAEAQAVEMLDRIAKHIYAAARSHEQAPPTAAQASVAAPIVPVAETPQGVAEWAAAQGAPVQVGAPVEGPAVAAAQDAAAESPDVIQWD
jgi:hypothetical protein